MSIFTDEDSIFRPPEEEEWIMVYSDERSPKMEEKKDKAKRTQID